MSEEKYVGTRFHTVFLRRRVPKDQRIEELGYWCKVFHSEGLAPVVKGRSMGNLSFRLRDGVDEFITTASGLGPKDELDANCFVKVVGFDMERGVVYASGTREPSSESIMHGRVYEMKEDVTAIFHGHDPLILKHSNKLGLVSTREWHPYGSLQLVRAVEEVLDENNFIVIKEHGFLSFGNGREGMKKAGSSALEVHNRAREEAASKTLKVKPPK